MSETTEKPLEEIPTVQIKRQGYWNKATGHIYHRLRVDKLVKEFCGWEPLQNLIAFIPKDVDDPKDTKKAFFTTLFLTGARAEEALKLRRKDFKIEEKVIHVEFTASKRYKKIALKPDGKHWITKPDLSWNREFDIIRAEPIVPRFERFLSKFPDQEQLLFPSRFQHRPIWYKRHGLKPPEVNEEGFHEEHPYGRQWAYLLIRKVNESLPDGLKYDLKLHQKWVDEDKNSITWKDSHGASHNTQEDLKEDKQEIHLWLHWFRSQRASQLIADYHLALEVIKEYFLWKDYATAERYAKQGQKTITDMMLEAKPTYA